MKKVCLEDLPKHLDIGTKIIVGNFFGKDYPAIIKSFDGYGNVFGALIPLYTIKTVRGDEYIDEMNVVKILEDEE